jgi:PAS domain S-box-containing protein
MSKDLQSFHDRGSFRCTNCNKLIAKKIAGEMLEIKCLRCGGFNYVCEKLLQPMIITDSEGVILYVNKDWENESGYLMHEAVGRKPSTLWGGNMSSDFYKDLWRVIKEERRTTSVKITNKNKTGEKYDVDIEISPVLDNCGNIVFFVGTELMK